MTAAPLLWPIDEAARQLGGLHPETVRRLVRRGDLDAVRIGRRLLILCAVQPLLFVLR